MVEKQTSGSVDEILKGVHSHTCNIYRGADFAGIQHLNMVYLQARFGANERNSHVT